MVRYLSGAMVGLSMLMLAGAAHAGVIFEYICDDGTCGGDSAFSATFEFDPSVVIGGTTITAANAGFLGWSFSFSDPGNLSLSGTTFLFNDPGEISISFNPGGTKISSLIDTRVPGSFIEVGTGTSNFLSINEGANYEVGIREVGSVSNNTVLPGEFVRRSLPVPEPATLTVFGLGLVGLVLMKRRKRAAA